MLRNTVKLQACLNKAGNLFVGMWQVNDAGNYTNEVGSVVTDKELAEMIRQLKTLRGNGQMHRAAIRYRKLADAKKAGV